MQDTLELHSTVIISECCFRCGFWATSVVQRWVDVTDFIWLATIYSWNVSNDKTWCTCL